MERKETSNKEPQSLWPEEGGLEKGMVTSLDHDKGSIQFNHGLSRRKDNRVVIYCDRLRYD